MYSIWNGVIRWKINDIIFDGNGNICSISLTIYEIFTKQLKCEAFDLENEGQGQGREKRNLHHSIVNVQFHIAD